MQIKLYKIIDNPIFIIGIRRLAYEISTFTKHRMKIRGYRLLQRRHKTGSGNTRTKH